MTTPDYAALIAADLRAYDNASERSQQSMNGILGPSDIGFCRQKAALVTKGIDPSDQKKMWAAQVGTAIHNYVEAALKNAHPDWLMGSIDKITVTATLPDGASISGHPDIIIPSENTILDIKTVDGFEWIRRNGTSDSHKYQRHLYALGAMQNGILDDSKPVYVGNLYFDRSGSEQDPILHIEEYDPDLTAVIESWISDVSYAVMHDEDASRDIAPSVCAQICEFYTACRGNLPVHEGQEFTEDPQIKTAIQMMIEAKEAEARAKRLKSAARPTLVGFNGTDGEYQVRWVEIQPTYVEGFQRAGSMRLDVVPLKRG